MKIAELYAEFRAVGLAGVNASMIDLQGSASKAAKASAELTRLYAGLKATSLAGVNASVAALQGSTVKASAAATGLVNGFKMAMVGVGSSMKGLHIAMAKVSAATAGIAHGFKIAMVGAIVSLGLAIRSAVKFETQMAMVSTMLDDVSMKRMPRFTRGIHDLSREFGESTATLAKGLYDILSASIAPEKALEVLRTSAKSAVGGFTSTAISADAITTILNSYGLSASYAGDVSDKLFATVKRGKLTFEELASGIGKAAATAAIAGVSLDELLAAVSTITRAGISSDQAMTSVVGTIRSFLKPTEEGAKLAKELGFELSTATLRAEGLSGVFKKLTGLTAEQLAELFPNIRGLKGVAAAMQDAAGHAKDLGMVTNSAGMAQEAFNKVANTTSFQLKKVWQGFIGVMDVIGEGLLPKVKELADWLNRLLRDNRDALIQWGNFAARLAVVVVAVGALVLGLRTAIKVIGGVAVAVRGLSVAMAFLAANPITIAIIAITVAVVALGYAINKLASYTAELSYKMRDALEAHDRLRQSGEVLSDRLEELGQKQYLTNEEMVEARGIITELESVHGKLNITLDETARSLSGVADELTRADKSAKETQVAITESRIAETKKNIREIMKEYEFFWKQFRSIGPGAWYFGSEKDLAKEREARIKGEETALHTLEKQLNVLKAQTDQTKRLDQAMRGGPSLGTMTEPSKKEDEKVTAAKATLDKELTEREQQQRLAMIDDVEKREIEAIRYEYDEMVARAEEANKDITDMTIREQTKRQAVLSRIEDGRRAAEALVHKKYAGEKRDEEDRIFFENADRKVKQEESNAEAVAEYNRRLDMDLAQERAGQIEDEHKRSLALLEIEKKEAIRQAEAVGADVAKVKELYGLKAKEITEKIKVAVTFDRGSWSGLADVWKNIQTTIMRKDPLLKEAKEQTGVLTDIRDAVKDLDVSGGATVREGGV